ncbi:amino acid ABC transporter permease [Streptomyces sp. NPDC059460]|uniref:amino acid ABC transporter permease n=1 Tax=Streptomyces sp. NPDC059460 TaxID=3346840 RepID=UPI0036951A6B
MGDHAMAAESAPAAPGDAGERPDELPSPVRLRHPWRWVAVVVLAYVAVRVVRAFAGNDNMHWDVVGHYLFAPAVLRGLLLTVELTAAAMGLAIAVGITIALMRLSPNPVLSTFGAGYVWFVRATPVVVQLLFWFFLAAVFPTISIDVPFGPTLFELDTNTLIGQFVAGMLGLGISESAYVAEIVRAGIASVDRGQTEASQSLGMSRMRMMRWVILPQAMRVIIPPVGNAVINMTKMTAVVLIIGLPDLMTSVQLIYSRNFFQIPLLTVACFWYVLLVSALTVLQLRLERRFGRGVLGNPVARRSRRGR